MRVLRLVAYLARRTWVAHRRWRAGHRRILVRVRMRRRRLMRVLDRYYLVVRRIIS
jgi:hypothetical protein